MCTYPDSFPWHQAHVFQVFIIVGIAVNCGANTDRTYLGAKYFYTGDAPFVGGIGGFASVFVTASFA